MTYPRKQRRPALWVLTWKPKQAPSRASLQRQYRERVKVWLKGKTCVVCPWLEATQCHHKFGRSGPLLLWEPGWLAVSMWGHQWIDANRNEARARGWLAEPGMWNNWRKLGLTK